MLMDKKPLKIFLFDGSFKTTPFINRLAKGLTARHEVYILGFSKSNAKRLNAVKYVSLGSNNNTFDLLKTSLSLSFRAGSMSAIVRTLSLFLNRDRAGLKQQNLKLLLKLEQPDVIHLQWPSTVSFFEQVLKDQKVHVVLSQRGYQNNVRALVDPVSSEYWKKWYPTFAGFHSVSKAMRATGDLLYASEQKMDHVIYTGLEMEDFEMGEAKLPKEPLQMISVGRPHWIKGYDDAIKACAILKEKGVAFHYQIVGAAGNEELLYLIKEFDLQQEVILVEKLPQKKVFETMKEAHGLLMPSLHEGIANVAVEAMALGTPVISTHCGGMAELIEHDKEGWLVPTRASEAMAEALITFTHIDETTLNAIRHAARHKVEQQFSLAAMLSGFEQLYQTVVRK